MSTDLKELLQRRAEDMRLPPDLPPATFRRARRRRGWTAAFAGVTTITLIAGTIVALQSTVFSSDRRIGHEPTPAPSEPTPAPTQAPPIVDTDHAVPAVWPEASLEAIQAEQLAVDSGADQWRTNSLATAQSFATDVLGWSESADGVSLTQISGSEESGSVGVGVLAHGPRGNALRVGLRLAQLAAHRAGGVWSVTDVTSDALSFEAGPRSAGPTCGPDRLVRGRPAMLCGSVPAPVAPGAIVRYALFQGGELDVSAPTDAPVWGEIHPDADGNFAGGMTENVVGDATVLLVELLDGDGLVVSAATERLPAPGSSDPSPSGPAPGNEAPPELTDQAAAMRVAILDAARTNDYERLRPLIDAPFTFSFGDAGSGSEVATRAIEHWKRDGFEPLRIMAALLDMPYTTVESEGRLIYVWPGIYNWPGADLQYLEDLETEWRSALEQIYPDFEQQLHSWIDYGSYIGWRIGITDDGHWQFFVAGD